MGTSMHACVQDPYIYTYSVCVCLRAFLRACMYLSERGSGGDRRPGARL